LWSCAATQHSEESNAVLQSPSSSCSLCCKKKEKKATIALLPSPSSLYCGAALQRNSTKKVMIAAVTFFSLLWSCVAVQLHKEGDGSCRRLLLFVVELRYSATEEGNSVVELRCTAA
jgi:hypothetical protein